MAKLLQLQKEQQRKEDKAERDQKRKADEASGTEAPTLKLMHALSKEGTYRIDANNKNAPKYNPMARKVLDPSVLSKISSGYGYGQLSPQPDT